MLKKTPYPEYADLPGWRGKLNEVIFGTESPAGRAFDLALIIVILSSVVAVSLESVATLRLRFSFELRFLEWVFTGLFTIEYVLRLLCAAKPTRYATSFFGVIDLLATIPTYLSLIVPGAQFLLVIRLFRILRVFRVLKLAKYISEGDTLMRALLASRHKIALFLFAVMTLVVILGSLMYLVEGEANGFTSIPRGIYWAVVTLTTVGYGDISPQTNMGQFLASIVMIVGYGIIAVPTGIVTAEIVHVGRNRVTCKGCETRDHLADAVFCRRCGERLER
jgi:voltage-gated potassium channel